MITYIVLGLIILFLVHFLYNSTQKPKNYPPGPKWYPIVGSFPQFKHILKSTKDVANAFATFSKQYKSNIIGLKLGSENVVIAFSVKHVRNIYLDDNFLGRPDIFFNRLRTLGTLKGITLSSGQLWKTQKKFVVASLKKAGYGKSTMETKVMDEIEELIKIIDLNPIDVDFRKLLSFSILKILWTFVDGTEISRDNERMAKLLQLMHRRTLKFNILGSTLNVFPWLRFFAPKKFGYNLLKEINLELEGFVTDAIEEHLQTWTEGINTDLIYSYISEIKRYDGTADTYFTYEQLKIICIDIFYAGTNITGGVMDFLFFAMAIHQDVQTKIQKILDDTFDPNLPLEYKDKAKVPYIEAIIWETERCYTNVPLLPARSPIKNAVLDGYEIPKGSTVYMSFDSIFNNSEYFDQPDIYKPERFLDSNGELILNEAFFPFGLGKRQCMGYALAKMILFMVFAEIIRKYKVYPVDVSLIKKEKFIAGIVRTKQKCPIKLVKRF